MKNVLLFIFLTFSVSSFSQTELNNASKAVKSEQPDLYNSVKSFAINKWEDNHEMIVYEINKQIEGFFEATQKLKEDPSNNRGLFFRSLKKWSNGNNPTIEVMAKNNTINWEMVAYEMKKQIEARDAY